MPTPPADYDSPWGDIGEPATAWEQKPVAVLAIEVTWPAAAVHWGQVLADVGASDPTACILPIEETLAAPVRLLGQAAPGEILVSTPVRRLGEGWFEIQPYEKSVLASTVVGLKPQRSPLALHGQRPLSRFVGRAREFALLAEILGQGAEGRGHVVGMVGEPGVGKPRLLYD
jgi:hypothetical protein